MLKTAPSLSDQIYDQIVDEICNGRLAPGMHLIQEKLAERFDVSRQPIQQAMNRLKADGLVEELGRRGLFVAPLDPTRMRDHYGIRSALDGWATRTAAQRIRDDGARATVLKRRGAEILADGNAAVAAGDIAGQVHADDAFHSLIYAASGNPMVAVAAEPHWRFLRRAMGDVLRRAEEPVVIWRQHGEILDAVASGDPEQAERLAIDHVTHAADRLAEVLEAAQS
ncbi:GntR family transcriptional regulator [Thalassobaculum sp. OXR-137]|uniref:GntR family transcriptional regulator n=1 Tax=Thalassobaculum sp. OXR-137 TaxID=3100173 RepID=UPI002AC89A1B|nr:GntR family transcriptional regulator [Thalassobaculum sp. OXR-137]WPZ35887.1 GntR family transcriptional regulator [Thalassobaculum sp. OXR-137]